MHCLAGIRPIVVGRTGGNDRRKLHLVSCTGAGETLDPGWVRGPFYSAVHRAGLAPIRFHNLRHTAAALAPRQGGAPEGGQRMLGHASIVPTLDASSHLFPMLIEASEAMDLASGA